MPLKTDADIQCRNLIEKHTGEARLVATRICEALLPEEREAILAAAGDEDACCVLVHQAIWEADQRRLELHRREHAAAAERQRQKAEPQPAAVDAAGADDPGEPNGEQGPEQSGEEDAAADQVDEGPQQAEEADTVLEAAGAPADEPVAVESSAASPTEPVAVESPVASPAEPEAADAPPAADHVSAETIVVDSPLES